MPDLAAHPGAEPAVDARPVLRVLRGTPDDVELAALVTVLAARSRPAAAAPAVRPSAWAAHWRAVGAAPAPGPGAWTASGATR